MSEGKISEGETAQPSSAMAKASPPTVALADLLQTAVDPAFTEDLALALLKRADLPPEVLEQLAKNANALKSRKVKIALVSHPHTPRHVSVPLARQFYTFDLMKVALSPRVPADVKVAVDGVLISRLKTVTLGERLTLARRASGRVAAALLLEVESGEGKIIGGKTIDRNTMGRKIIGRKTISGKTIAGKTIAAKAVSRDTRVMQAALENPRLTEALVIKSVLGPTAGAALVQAVARHAKWSRRTEIRAALLRSAHLSLARALEFSREIPAPLLEEVLASSRLPGPIKAQLIHQSNPWPGRGGATR
jgi:hypothetical protein